MRIILLGCGFLGSHLAESLAKLFYTQELKPEFLCIDDDTWEARNAANQNVRPTSLDEPKADTIARLFRDYELHAEPLKKRITIDNLFDLKGDLLIDCVDNVPTRQLAWAWAKAPGVATIHVGISKNGQGVVNWSSEKWDTFPFKPDDMIGRDLKNDDEVKEPPCEMYKYMFHGLKTIEAATKAIAFYCGLDPWQSCSYVMFEFRKQLNLDCTLEDLVQGEKKFYLPRVMTCWNTGSTVEPRFDLLTTQDLWFPRTESVDPNDNV